MYDSDKTALIIKTTAKEKGVSLGEMLKSCELNRDAISLMTRRGSWLQSNNLAKIADYLDCSVDYLLGRTDNPTAHIKATPLNSKLVDLLLKLTPEQQEFISAQIEGLLNAKK